MLYANKMTTLLTHTQVEALTKTIAFVRSGILGELENDLVLCLAKPAQPPTVKLRLAQILFSSLCFVFYLSV